MRLQSDIQKENDEFYKREIQRLNLVEKSATSKLEELARRADDKDRSIVQLSKKIGHDVDRHTSPHKRAAAGDENLDHLEVMSEFSTASNETEIRTDENILDFKVEDAEFYYDHFG